MTNLILSTDSYKESHWNQYPEGTEKVYSYMESRVGAEFPYTVFFGLQSILLKYLAGKVVTFDDIKEAEKILKPHFGKDVLNKAGWEYIVHEKGGKLPIIIKAVPEGTPVPVGNICMTIENTDPKCWWLTNHLESLLLHCWYPCTVATLSRSVKETIKFYLDQTSDSDAGLPFMLHDFGYRGVSSNESAEIGGAAHLVNFNGTDTLPAMQLSLKDYGANLDDLAFSVPATEHSVMTSLGKAGEIEIVKKVIRENPTGIISVVGDSYDIHQFVNFISTGNIRKEIEARDGVFVVRPDSITAKEDTPAKVVTWIAKTIDSNMGSTINSKGYKVLNPKIRILWGDGLSENDIANILYALKDNGFSVENIVFGMGGGLLQKVNRDTQRMAIKSSAQMRNGRWHSISKKTLDKESKSGRLRLQVDTLGNMETVSENEFIHDHVEIPDLLETIFDRGYIVKKYTLDEVRKNAEL